MRRFIKSIALTCLFGNFLTIPLFAQKKSLDEDAYKKWVYIEDAEISPNGKWISYKHRNMDSLLVTYLYSAQGTDTLYKCRDGIFSPDSRLFAYRKEIKNNGKKKRIQMLRDLQTGSVLEFARSEQLSFLDRNNHSVVKLVYNNALPDSLKKKGEISLDIIFYDPAKNDSLCYRNVSKTAQTVDGRWQFICRDKWSVIDLDKQTEYSLPVPDKANITLVNFNTTKNYLACFYNTNADKEQRIMLYDIQKKALADTISSYSKFIPKGFTLANSKLSFSNDGKKVYFQIRPKLQEQKAADSKTKKIEPQIWVWNKTSNFLSNKPIEPVEIYFCSLSLDKKKEFTTLNSAEMPYFQFPDGVNDDLTIGFSDLPYRHLNGIEAGNLYDAYLVDMNTGKSQKVLERKYYNPSISTDKRYIAWFEPDEKAWFSMDTKTLEKRNLTKDIPALFYNDEIDRPTHSIHFGSLGWSKEGHKLFVNSKYDWWLVDASGKEAPVCLTKGVGEEQKIVFRPIKTSEARRYYNPDSTYYFTAFQPSTKKSGYYKLENGQMIQLVFDDHRYSGFQLSDNKEKCIFRKESFTEYPEIYCADANLKNIQRVSVSDKLQSEYKWGTSELVSWVTFHGDTLQGILCKPEDFNPEKKYPMLVYFYEKKSDMLHKYNIPAPIGTVINWSYCVSNDYLVFIPDIVFRPGDPGKSSYDAVVSGVKSLTDRCPFIDKERIGLNGHSWGGYQTAYLITQTNMFKAAVSGAPVVNMTSAYGGVRWKTGKSRIFQYEYDQSRIGGTLWDKPMEYMRNSPLFYIPQVETPVLIMHNDKDGSVPWEQGIEFFMALRRLGKPAWLFNYRGQDHKLTKWDYRLDYSRRVMDFYNYYLKDGKKPDWME